MRILIAEDDQVLADALLRSLRTSGSAVDHVATGSQADAALMTNSEFDLLILDLGCPTCTASKSSSDCAHAARNCPCWC
jgi:two-component system OmpR family response regulator